MPLDALYEILLLLPADAVCRFRAICQPWRSLLSDQHFIAAHAARHPEPLIVAGYHAGHRNDGILFDIMDLSGRVVKRVRPTWGEKEFVTSTQLDLVCTAKGNNTYNRSFRLLNPASGAVYALPQELAEEFVARGLFVRQYRAAVVFGKVASTGEYKVLRLIGGFLYQNQLYEVFTLNGSIPARWRGLKAAPDSVDINLRVVVNGIVYLFSNEFYLDEDAVRKRIVSFDLGTEEWRAILRGPLISLVGNAVGIPNNHIDYYHLSLADLNGCLVVVHRVCSSSMNLWFLMDFEKCLWVKKHSIQVNLSVQHDKFHVHPLLVLNNGRIVTYIGTRGLLRIYNPRTSTYTDVAEMGPRVRVGLYTGNLLSLANCAS